VLFADAPASALRVEKTSYYLENEQAHERLLRLLPQTKFIFIFREPVARRHDRFVHALHGAMTKIGPRTENNPSRAVGRRTAKRIGEESNLRKRIGKFRSAAQSREWAIALSCPKSAIKNPAHWKYASSARSPQTPTPRSKQPRIPSPCRMAPPMAWPMT
jgi:hypothetical protein